MRVSSTTSSCIESLTSAEVAAKIADGARTAILPLGAIEQHGPHLPLSVDADHAEALAIGIADRLGNALVLPTIRVGYSPHHLSFPGTVSVRDSTLEAMCLDHCSNLAAHGFERVILFSGHIGNYPVMRDFEPRLVDAVGPGLQVIVFRDSAAILDAWREAARSVAGLADHVGGHADVAETSVMLVLNPGAVRVERAVAGYVGTVDEDMLSRLLVDGVHSVSPNGVLGDPHGMSAELGRVALDAVTDLIVEYARANGA
jgi:creatinine amidohydrolase